MTDARILLERHRPRLAYDSHEAYFADSAAIWTDSPTNELKRADGTLLAKPPKLSLAYLGPHTYTDGTNALASDTIGDRTRNYAKNAAALHANPAYRDRVYGHARKDGQGRLWLQYWLFYYYNDFWLLGPMITGGKHEGDWELVQIRLGPSEQPEQVVCTQHKQAESKPWSDTPKEGANTPLVYLARGSHANYFGTGSHWTGHWFDQADGKGPRVTPTVEVVSDSAPSWLLWPGAWGDTKVSGNPLDSQSPISPGRRAHWLDPGRLAGAGPKAAPAPPAPPKTAAHRDAAGDHIVISYDAEPQASALVVALRPKGSNAPATTQAFPLDGAHGEVQVPAGNEDYDVWTSVVDPNRGASEGVKAD
jgi:hypothetical protein